MSLDMGGIISQMGVVSLPILLGYVLHRLGILGGEFDRKLTTLVLDIALLYAVIASVLGNVFMFTVGAGMFRTRGLARAADAGTRPRAGRARRLASVLASLKTPTIVAGVATLVLALVGVSDLGIVGSAMSVVGQMSTPAALLIVGSSLAQYDPLEMVSNPHSYVAAAFRLLGIPLACLVALCLAGVGETERSVIVLECAMPAATNGALYCVQSGMDASPMMQVTFLSIAGSIATVPLVALLLGM